MKARVQTLRSPTASASMNSSSPQHHKASQYATVNVGQTRQREAQQLLGPFFLDFCFSLNKILLYFLNLNAEQISQRKTLKASLQKDVPPTVSSMPAGSAFSQPAISSNSAGVLNTYEADRQLANIYYAPTKLEVQF